ncbi:urease-enhancing factor [Helicobacter pylori]|nr:urease-enhancing factor [Helicobacter pylori]
MIVLSFIYFLFNNELNYHKRMIKVFELLKNSKIKGYKMKTIRNSVFIGASLLGGCTSVETYFDALRVASVKDACL